jgi:hypothetical protein
LTMVEEIKNRQMDVHRPPFKLEFNAKTFLKDGRTKGHVIHASDGKPFLVKYNELLIKEGKPCSLIIWLADPNVGKKDIPYPTYVSETFYHFFRPQRDFDKDLFCLDDGGLIVAEIVLEADESGLLYLIDDLNYRHITEVVLDKYYGSFRGQYDHIGQSMVGIAGKVLKEGYGISFLGVKTDKTRGFYWEISGHPPKKPFIPMIIKQLELIKDIKERKEIRENIYMSIIKNIIIRRFDPYMKNCHNANLENAWQNHCSEIRSLLSDNKLILSWLLDVSRDPMTSRGVEKFINSIMLDYEAKNVGWFKSINDGMRKLIKAQESGDKSQRNRIIDEIIIMEEDPIVKIGLENLKKSDTTIDIIEMIHETLSQLGRIFPIFDLSRIDEIKIGIEPCKKS